VDNSDKYFTVNNMKLSDSYQALRTSVGGAVKIIAVSKTKPVELISELYDEGHRDFGENRVQELVAKSSLLPNDIHWHFIGHLQTNKVKYIAPVVSVIQSVDSFRLLAEINKEAAKKNRIIRCLLQFHIATEESKFGLSMNEAKEILNNQELTGMQHVKICGVMGMATLTDDKLLIQREFRQLKSFFSELKSVYFKNDPEFCEISMGMSGDYDIAIREGSTMIRIGSLLFGER
jgi:PLP dependent protein